MWHKTTKHEGKTGAYLVAYYQEVLAEIYRIQKEEA